MNKIRLSIFLFSITFGNYLHAQSKKFDKEQKRIFKEADAFYYFGDFNSAINLYEKVEAADPEFAELEFKMAESYYELKKYAKARERLQKGVEFNSDALFYLAKVELYFGNLITSEEKLEEFKKSRDLKLSVIEDYQIELLSRNISNAREFMADPEVVNIINLGDAINTDNSEYVPIISSNETFMVFTSRRLRDGNLMDLTGQPYEDIYTTSRKSVEDSWGKAVLINGEINTDQHDACVGLSPDGNRLFVYRPNENLVGGDIFESDLIEGKWTVPIRMSENINNELSVERSASLSLDGKTFYFSSNREGGYGGFDIYRVILLPNGEWSLAKNLGATINTPYDDDAPFVHPDGKTLYFSSQGHKSMGGFDVFKSKLNDDETWSNPENMGYPTNTTKDDIFFTISANEQHGYYSSDKKGGFGNQDIYLIDYLEKSLRQSVIQAVVKDAVSGAFVAADVTIVNMETSDLTGVHVTNTEDGKFIYLVNPNVEYEVLVEAKGYDEKSEMVKFSIDDLRQTQKMEFILTTSQAAE